MKTLTSIGSGDRIDSIDAIRGLAILGIFFVNMQSFSSPWLYVNHGTWFDTPINNGVKMLIDIFAQASFYTLFSFLFGYSFMLFKERAEQKGFNFTELYSKRLLVLFVIGVVHAFFIWHGDILITYFISGFLLMLYRNQSAGSLLRWAMGFILMPSMLFGGVLFFANYQSPEIFEQTSEDLIMVDKSLYTYKEGTYMEITSQRVTDWLQVNGGFGTFFVIVSLFPMFLLGAYVAKKRWFHDVGLHMSLLKKLWFLTLSVFLIVKTAPYWLQENVGLAYIQDAIGGPASALFYAISVVLLFQKTVGKKCLGFLRYVGRMSMSNYLFQSVISTLIFYSYGLGLYGQISPLLGAAMVVFIFALQSFLSKVWLSYFRTGPVEWVWRSLTYGVRQPLRRGEYEG